MNILDQADTARLLNAVERPRKEEPRKPLSIYIPVLVAVTTGMRRGEILGLRWKDVDLDAGTLSVRQTLEQTRTSLAFKVPKTPRSRRMITLPALTVDALRRHKVTQAEDRLSMGLGRDELGLVCGLRDGSPRSPRELTKEFSRVMKRLGFALRFHDLRHTHISHLLAAGVHPKVASERAGHASVGITLESIQPRLARPPRGRRRPH